MLRENTKGKPPEVESTDAGYRGGATRSSDEDSVMGLERRGCLVQPDREDNWQQEDPIGSGKAVCVGGGWTGGAG